MPLTQSQRNLDEETSPDFYAGRKFGDVEQALLWTLLQEEPECPSRVLLDRAAHRRIVIAVSLRHVNRWRAPGDSIVARGARGKLMALGLWPLVRK